MKHGLLIKDEEKRNGRCKGWGKMQKSLTNHIEQNPYFGKNIKKLANYKPDTWRYRIGNYRFFYEINEQKKMVYMISADNRQNAY